MNEIVLALINRKPTICILLSPEFENVTLKVKVGTNKELKIDSSKILARSGILEASLDDIKPAREQIYELVSSIKFHSIWKIVNKSHSSLTIDEISHLIFGENPDYKTTFAIWIKAISEQIHFQVKNKRFLVNDEKAVQRGLITKTKKLRETEEINQLGSYLNAGELPSTLSKGQLDLIKKLKTLAVFGSKAEKPANMLRLIDELKTYKNTDKQRIAFDHLANVGVLSYDKPVELIRNEIVEEFPKEIEEYSKRINDLENCFGNRIDLTKLESFTIDDETTSDRDDAFTVEENVIWVHITDMASIIKDHPLIDSEARGRAASIYLPEVTIPMLPKILSEKIGSLNPGENRPCISLKLSIDDDGHVYNFNFEETVIRNTKAFSYAQVDEILSDNASNYYELMNSIKSLTEKYKEERYSNGAISIERPEMTVQLNDQMDINIGVIRKQSMARSIIENLMILYNCFAGKLCEESNTAVPYRLQSRLDINSGQKIPSGQLGWYVLSKMLRPARLSLTPGRHHGLGVDNYIQVTSPIRRYSDLLTQKQLKNAMTGILTSYSGEEILSICKNTQKKIRIHHRIENIRKKYWLLKFLQYEKKHGISKYKAVVLENDKTSLKKALLELEKYPFKTRCNIPNNISVGSTINIELISVDLWEKVAHFRLC